MKKQIIITIILLVAIAFTTAIYFNNLSSPGMRADQIMRIIPDDASLIFEFNNNEGFYDIYKENNLFTSVLGAQKTDELSSLQHLLLNNALLSKFLRNSNIYISVHPSVSNTVDLLFTVSLPQHLNPAFFDQLSKQTGNGLIITSTLIGKVQGYSIYINELKKRLYLINKGKNILSASFSLGLLNRVTTSAGDKSSFLFIPGGQQTNSLADLYVNYNQFYHFFSSLLINKNSDIFNDFKQFTGIGYLNLNYHSDALMFNGTTHMPNNAMQNFIDLFAGQMPVVNHLKDIFPATTAYSTNYAVSDPLKFESALRKFHENKNDGDKLFARIKNEAGISINTTFSSLLGNEFAVVTTRYFEKFAIVSVKDGSRLKELLAAVSTITSENTKRLNYEKLPLYLLGEPFGIFRKPYFMVIDNYLIMANSENELKSYYDIYINRKFLSKNDQYNRFDDLLSEKSNIAFLLNIKNTLSIFQRDLKPDFMANLKDNKNEWSNFYALSWQFAVAEKNFYTNFCLKLTSDTTGNKAK